MLERTDSVEDRISNAELRKAYIDWLEQRGDKFGMNAQTFSDAMREHGLEPARRWKENGKTVRGWQRVKLIEQQEPEVCFLDNI